MKAYYQDDAVSLYLGDCREVLPNLPALSAHVLLTDPPYFQVKDDEWDHQWDHAAEFLEWLGSVLDAAKPALTANASVWVFAGPALSSAVEAVVRARFRVLNHVRWVKEQGWHQKAEIAVLRRYLTPWESVIFAEQFGANGSYEATEDGLRRGVFEPIRAYLDHERDAAGVSIQQVNNHLGTATMAGHYFGRSQWAMPTAEVYEKLRGLFNVTDGGHLRREYGHLRREYEDLRREYEDLRREYEDLRRPFNLHHLGPVSDVWNFNTVAPHVGKHPCEKPQALLRHMIDVSSRPGDLILDPFAGSGSTLIAARDAGRRSVGVELDEAYCEVIAKRLSQGVLDFGASA